MESVWKRSIKITLAAIGLFFFSILGAGAQVAEAAKVPSLDEKIDAWFGEVTKPFVDAVFTSVKIGGNDFNSGF